MCVLIDEWLDPRVKTLFSGHDVKTVHDLGWDQLPDGPLLQMAQQVFDVFVTIDRNLEHQQNLRKLALGVVVVEVPKNQLRCYQAVMAELLAAVEVIQPGQVLHGRTASA